MTVNTSTSSASYSGNGSTQIFAVPFYFLVDTDVKITKKTASTGLVTTLVLNSDYTLTGAGNTSGGSATLVAAPLTGDQIFIQRNVDAVQQTAYPSNSTFPSASHEKALDRLTMLVQQLQTSDSFTLTRAPLGSTYDLGGSTLINSGTAVNPNDLPNLAQVQAAIVAGATGQLALPIGSSLVGFLPSGTGASTTRTVQDKLRDTVSIKDFGAVCDGVHDDSVAINNALSSGASRVRFIGTCLVSKPLYYPSNIIIEFDQGASVVPVALGSFQKLQLNGVDWGYAIFMNVNWQASSITDSNVTFINPRCSPSSAWNGHFIGSRKLSNLQVIGSYCTNMADVVSSMACVDVLVKDGWCNNISNCAYDFWEGPARITVVNCTTINANGGVNFNSVDTYNNGPFTADTLLVQGCRFYSSATSAVYVAPLGNTSFCTNIKILDNFIDQANTATGTGGGGRVWAGITVQRSSVVDIRGNTMNRIGSGAAPIIVTTDAGGASQQSLISDNTINNSTLGASGFYIQCYGANSKVWNNRALNSTATGGVGIAVNDPTSVVGPNLMAGATTYLVNQNPGGGATSAALQLDQNTTVSGGRWDTPQPIRAQAFQPGVSYAIGATGTTSGTALQLTKPFNYVNSGAANSGVILPQNTGNRAGEEWIIWNQSGNTILVYAWPGDTIGGSGSISVATSTKVRLIAITGTLWVQA